jgi:hypothetical protein
MADRYWVGGTGTWVAGSTTNWSVSPGGASGASVPTAADSVFFDQAGTYAVTLTGALTCLDFTVSAGTVTFGSSGTPTISGSMSLVAGTVWNASGTITFNATTTGKTITTNGVTLQTVVRLNGTGGGWTLGSALALAQFLDIVAGTFTTNNYNLSATQLSTSFATVRVINLGSSTVTLSANSNFAFSAGNITNLTFNAGTSQINITEQIGGLSSGGLTFYNVAFTSNISTIRPITGTNTFNNLAVTGRAAVGSSTVTFAANQTINGTLSTTGTAGNRPVFFFSANYGIGWVLTCNSAASLTDANFRDIYVRGTAAPISGTRIGNCGNCQGITFSTPKTVYWNLFSVGTVSWLDNGWCATSGGTPSTNNFPLPQDIAVFDNAGSCANGIATDNSIFYLPSVDMSARTTALSFQLFTAMTVFGDWKNGSGTTLSGTGGVGFTFSGGGTQTITSAGKTFTCAIFLDTYGGTVQLADALNMGGQSITVTNGTFDTQGFALTCGQFISSNGNVRTINLRASTVNLNANTTQVFLASTSTNLTLNAGTSQINMNGSVAGIAVGTTTRQTFYNVSFTSTGTTGIPITGLNTFNNVTIAAPSSAAIKPVVFSSNQTINGTLTCAGASAVRRIFLQSDLVGTQRDLTVGALVADDCDFRDIKILGTAIGTAPTRAGDCGNNVNITFPAPKTVYWNLAGSQNWSATGWATLSGGAPAVNNFPLAQDTAVFDNTGSAGTVSINTTWNIGTFDASLRTSAMTFGLLNGVFPLVFGNWTFGIGVTTSSSSGIPTFGKKNATQTITSNGVIFNFGVFVNEPSGTLQIADALSLAVARTLSISQGNFDAATYNITTGGFQNSTSTNIIRMGTGTWTITRSGTCWDCAAGGFMFAGTSTIVLSDTSTTARTFNGGSLYYNKLTIGGATGTSTLTISGANTFGELASTKTVAHTIDFSSNITTFGKWSVTGTVGNVVLITGSSTANIIAGPAVTGVNYLNIVGGWSIITTSPGEFFAGPNSTGVGGAGPFYALSAPTPRTLYWRGGTGAWSSTTSWATTSGGTGPAAIPTSLDAVIFNSASNATAYTATISGVTIARCASFTMAGPASGNVTLAGSVPIAFHGNVSFAATGITRTYTGSTNWAGNSSYTFTTNGFTLFSITVTGIGSTWTLGSAVSNIGSTSVAYGSFVTNNFSLSANQLPSNTTPPAVRSISFGSSTVTLNSTGTETLNFLPQTNLTFDAGTSTLIFSGNGTPGISSSGLTFNNVSFTGTTSTNIAISGANTFNNLTLRGQTTVGITPFTFSANQTISTLTLNAGTASSYRIFLASNTLGTPRTLTVGTLTAGAADIDFRDIVVIGAAAPLTGTRFGDAKGNSGITFPAAKTVYYRNETGGNWGESALGSWSATSGGTANATMFPLAQDTAVFLAAYPFSGFTVGMNASYNIGTIDMSLRTSNTIVFSTGSSAPQIYGNWINGTGTTFAGTNILTFAGRTAQTITSAGRTFTQDMVFWTPGGSITLLDAFISNRFSGTAIQQNQGTFDANGYNVTLSNGGYFSNSTLTRTAAIGSGTWVLGINGGVWTVNATNFTITGAGTISLTSASAKTFAGGSISYSGITLNQGGAGTLTISGNNTFANITKTAVGATTISLGNTTQRVGAFAAAGTAGNLLTITGTSVGSPAALIYTGAGFISGLDYLIPTFVRAYPTTSTWYAGTNSTNNGTLGWIFSGPPAAVYNVFIVEGGRASDVTAAAFGTITYDSNIAESSRASDSVAAREILFPAISESARTTDSVAAQEVLFPAISETARPTDSVASKATFNASNINSVIVADTAAAREILFPAILEQASASETNAAREILFPSVSETASTTDSVTAREILFPVVSEQARASETNSAREILFPAISEAARVSETNASKVTFGSSVSDTARAADSIAAREILFPAISEQARASETNAAAQRFGTNISEQARASETIAAQEILFPLIAETVRASETNAAKVSFLSSVSDTARGADSIAAASIFYPATSDSARASETAAAAQRFGTNVSEQARASEANAAVQVFKSNASEQARAQDAISGQASFGSAVNDSARVQDTASSSASFGSSLSETARVSEANAAQATFNGNIADTAQALDSISVTATFGGLVFDSARVQDVSAVAASTFNAPVSETASASETTAAKATFGSNVSDTAQVADTPLSKVDFLGSVAESARGLDSISVAQRFATAIAESSQAANIFSAIAAFKSAISETSRASEINTATASFGSSVANTARASDAIASKASFGSAVNNTVQVSDSSIGFIRFPGSIAESVQVSEQNASTPTYAQQIAESARAQDVSAVAASTFNAAAADNARALDSTSSSQEFGSNVANTVRVSDSPRALASFGGAVSEASRALDSVRSNPTFATQVSNLVQVSDASGANASFGSNFSATVQAQDAALGSLQFNSSAAETARASETTASSQGFGVNISESATASSTILAQAIFRGIIEETARGSDQFSTTVVFLAAFSEFARANAESVGFLTGSRAVSESGRVSDSAAAVGELRGYISESARGEDSIAAKFFFDTFINESSRALDSVDAPGSTYNAAVSNLVQAADAPTAGAIFYAAVIAYSGITDLATARYLWELIDDTQTPDWGVIDDTQSAGWVEVNDIQAASWQNVGNTQADSWTQIDDTQDPDWVRITP